MAALVGVGPKAMTITLRSTDGLGQCLAVFWPRTPASPLADFMTEGTVPAVVLHHYRGISVPHDVPPINCVHVTKFIILLNINAPGQNLSELCKAELAESMAGVGVIVQHDKDGKLPIVDLGPPYHSEIGQRQYRELIHGHKDIAGHFSDPLQEREVSIVSCEHNLEVPHHHLTPLVELVQCLVLVLGIASHTQPIQSSRTHCSKWR